MTSAGLALIFCLNGNRFWRAPASFGDELFRHMVRHPRHREGFVCERRSGIRIRPSPGYSSPALLIFIQILLRHIVFGNFVRRDFAFVSITDAFDTAHHFSLERVSFLDQFIHAL
jgi:hypothetical protein